MSGPLWNEEEHKQFLTRLAKSWPAVFAFAGHLYRKGHTVELRPPKPSPSPDLNTQYIDAGDVFIVGPGWARQRFEVKGIDTVFTDRSDWPHTHFFISNKAKVERELGLVTAYIIINRALTHAGIVLPEDSASEWYDRPCSPKNLPGRTEINKCCPLHLVRFIRL